MPPVQNPTVGDVVARFLERCGVTTAFGVISIHNMPILDAFGRRAVEEAAKGKPAPIDFVMARGEQGALNMADAYARVRGSLGVGITSTGTAAGNACGSMVEAQTAGTPVLHLTGQIEVQYLDRNLGYIHEARDQLTMMSGVSKRAFRVWTPQDVLPVLKQAVQLAMTPPMGPVSVEIPIDVQLATLPAWPADFDPLPIAVNKPSEADLDRIAERLAKAKRPLIWLGGGARAARAAAEKLVSMGFGFVSSVQGRGILPEDHPASLGAYNLHKPAEELYATCDALLVVGSRLRSNETLTYKLKLPKPLIRVDADPVQADGPYPIDDFVCGDSVLVLEGLIKRLAGKTAIDPALQKDVAAAKAAAEAIVLKGLGPYESMVGELQAAAGRDFIWVRDVTLSNSTWGNRSLKLFGPRDGVHAMGGGIGQGIQMALGAAKGAPNRKVLCLSGDGGLMVNVGELASLVQEKANVTIVLMNDGGYGVIRNIQDAIYGSRRVYTELHNPDFELFARSLKLSYKKVSKTADMAAALKAAVAENGPVLVEVDMKSIGNFATAFAGPPVRKEAAKA